MTENKNIYVTVAFAGVALMVALLIGVVVIRRRNNRYPHHQVIITQTLKLSPSHTNTTQSSEISAQLLLNLN